MPGDSFGNIDTADSHGRAAKAEVNIFEIGLEDFIKAATSSKAQDAEILAKWCSQKCPSRRGNNAIDSSKPANGMIQARPSVRPSSSAAKD